MIQKEVLRRNKINNFISSNPSYKEIFFSEGAKFQIVDIIEGKPVYVSTDNASAAKALKTNRLYSGASAGLSLDGDGMSMAMWDGGWVLRNHNEFNNSGTPKVTCPDAPVATPDADGHATHVAGTICAKGANASAKGMSPKASLRSYDWTDDIVEVTSEASTNGLLLSNHSYGVPIFSNGEMQLPNWSPGCYNDDARDWDAVHYNNPYYLMVCSAGNEGNESYSGGL
ncbi:S8 family serine peptidase [Flavobacterium sp. 3HN19-14]|uniref:S8 family serine peptidase n=1 Tax=Flavobacterium sp. 3HN19-14 TaxID=3448133 RepID=UPI003EE0B69B